MPSWIWRMQRSNDSLYDLVSAFRLFSSTASESSANSSSPVYVRVGAKTNSPVPCLGQVSLHPCFRVLLFFAYRSPHPAHWRPLGSAWVQW